MKNTTLALIVIIILTGIGIYYTIKSPEHPQTTPVNAHYSTPTPPLPTTPDPSISPHQRDKFANCVSVNALPDSDCTPGAIIPEATKDDICVPGYSKKVRNVSESVKKKVYAEYNVFTHTPGQYEVDHLISLELGGSNDIANLWPEPAQPIPGFHQKDQVENYLHNQVCDGKETLPEAQFEISTNWEAVYERMNREMPAM